MELPPFVKEIKPPAGMTLAADSASTTVYELEGDVYALNLVDLEREGLVEYRYLLKQVKASENNENKSQLESRSTNNASNNNISNNKNHTNSRLSQSQIGSPSVADIIRDIIQLFNMNERNTISLTEAENIISRSSYRLGRNLEDKEIKEFFQAVQIDADGNIRNDEFQRVFEQLFK
jgi:hypothetical protein